MGYLINGKSLLNSDASTVFIDYLAAAPRNREWLVDNPQYRGVGTALVFYAVCHSWLLGLNGRVTLVSLPSERTRKFYAQRSFTKVSESDDGIIEFELEPEAAQRWLKDMGVLS